MTDDLAELTEALEAYTYDAPGHEAAAVQVTPAEWVAEYVAPLIAEREAKARQEGTARGWDAAVAVFLWSSNSAASGEPS